MSAKPIHGRRRRHRHSHRSRCQDMVSSPRIQPLATGIRPHTGGSSLPLCRIERPTAKSAIGRALLGWEEGHQDRERREGSIARRGGLSCVAGGRGLPCAARSGGGAARERGLSVATTQRCSLSPEPRHSPALPYLALARGALQRPCVYASSAAAASRPRADPCRGPASEGE